MPLSSFVQELLAPWYSFRSVCRRILVAFPQLRVTVLRTHWYLSLTGQREYCPDVWFDGSVYHCAVLCWCGNVMMPVNQYQRCSTVSPDIFLRIVQHTGQPGERRLRWRR